MDTIMRFRLTMVEELLGTAPGDPEIYRKFIESRRAKAGGPEPVESETETLPTVDEEIGSGMTVFHRLPGSDRPSGNAMIANGQPMMYDYQIKGMFKDACGSLRRAPGMLSQKLKAFKKEIDGLIFVEPRMIPLVLPEGGVIGICQRPLRAQTAQGERIALAISESVPAGTVLEFGVRCFRPDLFEYIAEWMDYGQYRGLGQWRNSGKGRFTFEVIKEGPAAPVVE